MAKTKVKKRRMISIIKQKIINCVDKLYLEDKYLFDCEICERCLMFRLAYYLQIEFFDYFVDCEFNKMGFYGYKHANKVEPIRHGKGVKKMYADIIIHKRNSNIQDNFICLEIKRTRKGLSNDLKRLKNMTRERGFSYKYTNYIYAYNYGFLILLPKNKDKPEIKIFKNGEEIL